MVMATAKNKQIAVMYTIRPSTLGAKFDACSGYSGSCDCTALVCSLRFRIGRVFASTEDQYPRDDRENREQPADANDAKNRRAVACGRRVVLKAVQQKMVDWSANLAGRCVDQPESHIARRVFDSVKVARNAPFRSQQHDAACVRENIGSWIERVAEVRRLCDRVDRIFCAGQEVPTGGGLRTAKVRESRRFLLRRHIGRLARVEAYEDDLIIGAGIEGKHFQRTDHALLDLIAEHRAAVIHQREKYRLAVEIITKSHVAAGFVFKTEGHRDLAVERRLEADILERRGKAGRRRANIVGNGLRRDARAASERHGQRQNRKPICDGANLLHRYFFSAWAGVPGNPFSAMIFIASETGICAMPAL